MFNDSINSFGDILEQYMKWDANNYVRIATGGYTYYTEGENFTTLAFFPLYPWLMRIVNIIFAFNLCQSEMRSVIVEFIHIIPIISNTIAIVDDFM